MKVELFIPCFVDQLYPEVGVAMAKVLKKYVEVGYNPDQTCCGQLAFNSGYWDHAKSVGEKFIRTFANDLGDKLIVVPSASCASMVKKYYHELFYNTALHNEYQLIQKRMFEFTDFLVNVLEIDDVGATFKEKITYHDSCAAVREYGLKDEPRNLLKWVKGLEICEMKESDVCCGFGGTFSIKNEPISTAMAQQKVKNALQTGASYVTSTEASCLMHLEGYIKKHNLNIKTIHIANILASGW
ncbi:MAG: (Fe-S)-binding protein [Bacteroidota bacterium]|nr:(Fe-S)-binding protein [Bacteroidota bacterium]